jgi:hypothetical protein
MAHVVLLPVGVDANDQHLFQRVPFNNAFLRTTSSHRPGSLFFDLLNWFEQLNQEPERVEERAHVTHFNNFAGGVKSR